MREENGHGPSLTAQCNRFFCVRMFYVTFAARLFAALRGAVPGDRAEGVTHGAGDMAG